MKNNKLLKLGLAIFSMNMLSCMDITEERSSGTLLKRDLLFLEFNNLNSTQAKLKGAQYQREAEKYKKEAQNLREKLQEMTRRYEEVVALLLPGIEEEGEKGIPKGLSITISIQVSKDESKDEVGLSPTIKTYHIIPMPNGAGASNAGESDIENDYDDLGIKSDED